MKQQQRFIMAFGGFGSSADPLELSVPPVKPPQPDANANSPGSSAGLAAANIPSDVATDSHRDCHGAAAQAAASPTPSPITLRRENSILLRLCTKQLSIRAAQWPPVGL